jgi:transcriptional regulator with XRE-family HTH domain
MSYTYNMGNTFGQRVRERRVALSGKEQEYSLRQVAKRVGVTPSFLSKVERGDLPPPSEEKIKRLAEVLEENPDLLLAVAGKVSSDLREAIVKRPQLFAELIRQVKDLPEQAVLRIVREVRDGKW